MQPNGEKIQQWILLEPWLPLTTLTLSAGLLSKSLVPRPEPGNPLRKVETAPDWLL